MCITAPAKCKSRQVIFAHIGTEIKICIIKKYSMHIKIRIIKIGRYLPIFILK